MKDSFVGFFFSCPIVTDEEQAIVNAITEVSLKFPDCDAGTRFSVQLWHGCVDITSRLKICLYIFVTKRAEILPLEPEMDTDIPSKDNEQRAVLQPIIIRDCNTLNTVIGN